MTGQDPGLSDRESRITYQQAQGGYRSTSDARERYEDMAIGDISSRAIATLKVRGMYDPDKHGVAGKHQTLTAAEHLEILAAGEVLARHYRHQVDVDQAVKAGASWSQIAEAVCPDEQQVRQRYREWAEGQHDLHVYYEGKSGLDYAEYAAAIRRASGPAAGPAMEHEAGK